MTLLVTRSAALGRLAAVDADRVARLGNPAGAALLVRDPTRQLSTVFAEVPLLAVLDAGYSGAWYLPDIDERRIDSISHQFAYWLRREMGI